MRSSVHNAFMNLAERMSRLGTETAFEVLAAAKAMEAQGRSIVHLEIGEPDFNTPANIVEAGVRALRDGWHHYSPAAGLPRLRECVAEMISRTRGISVHPDEVVVTPGGKPIIFFSLLALVESGQEVIYPNPGFPIYESMIRFVGGKPMPVRLREELDFRLNVDEVLATISPRTRLLILNSPNNPTGSVLSSEDLQALAEGLVRHPKVQVLSDEIYSRILYDGKHESIVGFPGMKERTILLDGFSKTYAMTGWRLGYGVMARSLAGQMVKLMINSNSCTASFTQLAGVEALEGDQSSVDEMVQRFRRRRDRVAALLNEIEGVSCRVPMGAFYLFPNVEKLNQSAAELQKMLLQRAGVAALAGTSFGSFGEGYLRISYAASMEALEEGIARFSAMLEEIGTT